jgi:hypothetical protein
VSICAGEEETAAPGFPFQFPGVSRPERSACCADAEMKTEAPEEPITAPADPGSAPENPDQVSSKMNVEACPPQRESLTPCEDSVKSTVIHQVSLQPGLRMSTATVGAELPLLCWHRRLLLQRRRQQRRRRRLTRRPCRSGPTWTRPWCQSCFKGSRTL